MLKMSFIADEIPVLADRLRSVTLRWKHQVKQDVALTIQFKIVDKTKRLRNQLLIVGAA